MADIIKVDVIILSFAQNSALKALTDLAINSLLASEEPDQIKFNVIVIESEKSLMPYQYPQTTTLYPEAEFGYNKYMNIGITQCSAEYICLCNNDLMFYPYWATEILKSFAKDSELSSASPACSFHHPKMGFDLYSGIHKGFRCRYEVAGWCLFLKKEVLGEMGSLDENYRLYCSDNDYANMLLVLGRKHALVTSAIVDHLDGATFNCLSISEQMELTFGEFFYYEKKWKHRLVGSGWNEFILMQDRFL